MKDRYDAIVVGAGHNGLVAAAVLSRAGLDVLVVERRSVLGGLTSTEEIWPGFKVDAGPSDASHFRDTIVAELDLENRGLAFLKGDFFAHILRPNVPPLAISASLETTINSLSELSAADAYRYPKFCAAVQAMNAILEPIMSAPAPEIPQGLSVRELTPWIKPVLQLRLQDEQTTAELLRAIPMPIRDLLDDWFESPELKGALATIGLVGSIRGPYSPGTSFNLLYQLIGRVDAEKGFIAPRQIEGGTGRLCELLAEMVLKAGGDILLEAEASSILNSAGTATGVSLADGRSVHAGLILAGISPGQVLNNMVNPELLELRTTRRLNNIRYRGSMAKLDLALSGLPAFPQAEMMTGEIIYAPDMEYVEKAHDDAKYGKPSREPVLRAHMPTILDPSLAPEGQHLLSIQIQYVPHFHNGTSELEKKCLDILETQAPGLSDLTLHKRILSGSEWQSEYRLPEGSIFHGQMDLDQLLLMRPIPGYARYQSPIPNLYFCGSGTHPGGGVTGLPGYLAAQQALRSR
jgi:phytoene dehydrogenase-like protein